MAKSLKEIRIELANAMIEHYVESVGLSREDTYNEIKECWCWKRGSADIEVFVQSVAVGNDKTREYLRIFSYLADIPKVSKQGREEFLLKLLEANDKSLGVKLTVMEGTTKVYATYERDINGMDFSELSTCISDLEWWADKLDDELKSYNN
jgi:DNA mismatch repair ATPase MutS